MLKLVSFVSDQFSVPIEIFSCLPCVFMSVCLSVCKTDFFSMQIELILFVRLHYVYLKHSPFFQNLKLSINFSAVCVFSVLFFSYAVML